MISSIGFLTSFFFFFYILTCIIYIAGNEKRSEHTWFQSGDGDGDAVFSASTCPLLPFGLLLFPLLSLTLLLSPLSISSLSHSSSSFSLLLSLCFLSIAFFLLSFSSFSFPPPLLDPSSGFYSQRIRALWHAYGNGRVRHAPLKQLRYLCKNASLSLYFQPFLSF